MTESRTFYMMERLHADIFFQDRYMLNEIGVMIKVIRSKDAFCLMGACKAKILHASMFVRKVKLMPSVFLAHVKTLERGTAKYRIRRMVCSRSPYHKITWKLATKNCSPDNCPRVMS